MFGYSKEICPPSGVEACGFANFTGTQDENLIVAKHTVLEIYVLQRDNGQSHREVRKPLQLIYRNSLYGNIESLAIVKFPKMPDLLVLTFKDAKVSILEWNPQTHDIDLVSMHYFEDLKQKSILTDYFNPPLVRVDPSNRCTAILCYDQFLAVIPFAQNVQEDFQSQLTSKNSRVLPSYIIELQNLDTNVRIDHLKDFTFLDGYHQPTILILHEPLQTSAGRSRVSNKSCVATAISLDMIKEKHPVIWSVSELPFDCFQLLAIPTPIGGVLVLSTNSIIFCYQNIKYKLALNHFVEQSTSRAYVTELSQILISLDAARFTFLSANRFMASLKGGELYIFTIVADASAVRRINISKGSASVISSCICALRGQYFFLGSRIGDSVLVEYSETSGKEETAMISPLKIQKTENHPQSSSVSEFDLDEDIAAFYSKTTKILGGTEYRFTKLDSIMNIGPLSDFCFGQCSDRKRDDFSKTEKAFPNDPEEIIACSGHGKNGVLTILQRGVRPSVTISFELAGCRNIWTLKEPSENIPESKPVSKKRIHRFAEENTKRDHTLLLVSTDNSSRVLTANDELVEITGQSKLSFFVGEATLNAGNFQNGQSIVQIGEFSVRLLGSAYTLIDTITFADSIADSVIRDPFILLSFGPLEPYVFLFLNDCGTKWQRQEISFDDSNQASDNVVSYCLYRDVMEVPLCPDKMECVEEVVNEVAVKEEEKEAPALQVPIQDSKDVATVSSFDSDSDAEEMAMFYGDAADTVEPIVSGADVGHEEESKIATSEFESFYGDVKMEESKETTSGEESGQKASATPKFYCLLTRKSGLLEIYTIQRKDDSIISELYFSAERFAQGIPLLCNEATAPTPSVTRASSMKGGRVITEIQLCLLGDKPMPYLFAFTDYDDLYIYETFHYQNEVRFKRFQHTLIARPLHRVSPESKETNVLKDHRPPLGERRLYEFHHGTKSGVFIAGLNPFWIFCERSHLRLFPMTSEPFVDCYADFNNTEFCPDGFIYSVENTVNISRILPSVSYENTWAVRKLPLRQGKRYYTPHKVCYHKASKTVAVAVSYSELVTDPEMNRVEQSGGLPRFEDKYELFLVDPSGNCRILNTFPFGENEHILALGVVKVNIKPSINDKKVEHKLLCVGTGIILGEDKPCKGNVFVFDVFTHRAEDNTNSLRIKLLVEKKEKGPVSAVGSILGNLIIAIGPKLLIYNFENGKELVGKAFFDTQFFIVSIKTLKHYIIIADMYNSVYFLIWKRLIRELSFLGKDYGHLQLTEAEFVLDNDKLGIFVADKSQNAQILNFDPENRYSRSRGKMLIPVCEYHLGETVLRAHKTRTFENEGVRYGSLYVTTSGAIGFVGTLSEEAYNCLLTLQSKMLYGIPHAAGLNPKAFRKYKPKEKQLRPRNNIMLDFDLLLRYNSLGAGFQNEFANLVRASPDQIFQYLNSVNVSLTIC